MQGRVPGCAGHAAGTWAQQSAPERMPLLPLRHCSAASAGGLLWPAQLRSFGLRSREPCHLYSVVLPKSGAFSQPPFQLKPAHKASAHTPAGTALRGGAPPTQRHISAFIAASPGLIKTMHTEAPPPLHSFPAPAGQPGVGEKSGLAAHGHKAQPATNQSHVSLHNTLPSRLQRPCPRLPYVFLLVPIPRLNFCLLPFLCHPFCNSLDGPSWRAAAGWLAAVPLQFKAQHHWPGPDAGPAA